MAWVPVTDGNSGAENEMRITAYERCFKHTADSRNDHLDADQLLLKQRARFQTLDRQTANPEQIMYELSLFDRNNDGNYTIALAFGLSVFRTSRPRDLNLDLGPAQTWDWYIHIGVHNHSQLNDQQIRDVYTEIRGECRSFLNRLNSDPNQPHPTINPAPTEGKRLLIGVPAPRDTNDAFYILLMEDVNAGVITINDLGERAVDVDNYFRQDPPPGLGRTGRLDAIQLTRIS